MFNLLFKGQISVLNNLSRLPWPVMAQKWKDKNGSMRINVHTQSAALKTAQIMFHPDRHRSKIDKFKATLVSKVLNCSSSIV